MGSRVHAKLGRTRFATQVYSRLTGASPEMMLVFMHAGQGPRHHKQVRQPCDRVARAADLVFQNGIDALSSQQAQGESYKDRAFEPATSAGGTARGTPPDARQPAHTVSGTRFGE